jgi:DNA-binding MarR family transcriptional regulator
MQRLDPKGKSVFGAVEDMPGHLMRRLQQIAVSMFLAECRDHDLTPLQFSVLAALHDNAPVDQVTLGGLISLDRTTIGIVVSKLEERGLASRTVSDRDRRSKIIRLTPEGARALDAVFPEVERMQARLLAPLDDKEQRQFIAALRKIIGTHNAISRAPLRS